MKDLLKNFGSKKLVGFGAVEAMIGTVDTSGSPWAPVAQVVMIGLVACVYFYAQSRQDVARAANGK